EQALALRIESHGLGAFLCLNVAYRLVFVRALPADHRYCAFAVGCEDQFVFRIEGDCIDPFADWQGSNHFAVRGVHHGQHFATAADEEPGVGLIQGYSSRCLTSGDRPLLFNVETLWIEGDYCRGLLQIHEPYAFSIYDCGFGWASHADLPDHFLFI